MTQNKMESQIIKRVIHCLEVLTRKHREYTTEGSPFEHFELAAAFSNTTPDEALWGMLAKHLASVVLIQREMHSALLARKLGVKDLPKPRHLNRSHVSEKFTDLINYLLLLEAMGEHYGLFQDGEEQKKDNRNQQNTKPKNSKARTQRSPKRHEAMQSTGVSEAR